MQQADPWHQGRRSPPSRRPQQQQPSHARSASSSGSAGSWHRVGQDHWDRWTPTDAQRQQGAQDTDLEAEVQRLRQELAEHREQLRQLGAGASDGAQAAQGGGPEPTAQAATPAAPQAPTPPGGTSEIDRLWPPRSDWLRDLNTRTAPGPTQRPVQYPGWVHLPFVRTMGIELPQGPSDTWPETSSPEVPNLQGPTDMEQMPLFIRSSGQPMDPSPTAQRTLGLLASRDMWNRNDNEVHNPN